MMSLFCVILLERYFYFFLKLFKPFRIVPVYQVIINHLNF